MGGGGDATEAGVWGATVGSPDLSPRRYPASSVSLMLGWTPERRRMIASRVGGRRGRRRMWHGVRSDVAVHVARQTHAAASAPSQVRMVGAEALPRDDAGNPGEPRACELATEALAAVESRISATSVGPVQGRVVVGPRAVNPNVLQLGAQLMLPPARGGAEDDALRLGTPCMCLASWSRSPA